MKNNIDKLKNVRMSLSFFIILILFAYFPSEKVFYTSAPAFNESITAENANNAPALTAKDMKDPGNILFNLFNPTAKNDPEDVKLVVIDPGHGGIDPGANKGDLLEKDISLDIALKLDRQLRKSGIDTYLTRSSSDSSPRLKDRIGPANNKDADLFISLHCNWFEDSSYDGVMILYRSNRASAHNLSSKKYAEIIQKELVKNLSMTDKGVVPRSDLYVLNAARVPSIIVELGFLSNQKDARLLSDDTFRQKAAEVITAGIVKALDGKTVDN